MNAPKQQLHGIPMYKILNSIIQMNTPRDNGKKRWATTGRIGKELGEKTDYILKMLNYYWGNNLVKRLPIKKAGMQDNSGDGASFHWVITNKGKRRHQKLMERFGDIDQFFNRLPAVISVQPVRSPEAVWQDRTISVQHQPEIPPMAPDRTGQN